MWAQKWMCVCACVNLTKYNIFLLFENKFACLRFAISDNKIHYIASIIWLMMIVWQNQYYYYVS